MSSFYKYFPVPEFLSFQNIGLDISDQSIKFIELNGAGRNLEINKYGEVTIPTGVIQSGEIKDRNGLINSLKEAKKNGNIEYANISLPEERAYIIRLKMPAMPEEQLRESIALELEEHIPLPSDQVIFDYDIYQAPVKNSGIYDLSVSIFPSNDARDYENSLLEAGIKPLSLEVEVSSLARAFISRGDDNTYMIVDIGKTRANFSIVSRGMVLYTSTNSNIGGDYITKAIQKNLNVSYEEAEDYKVKRGLMRGEANRHVFESLIPVASVIKDEISRHLDYWFNHIDTTAKNKIRKIIFCGGQSTLPGLADYIASNLSVSCVLGQPWLNVCDLEDVIPSLNYNNSLRFGTAIGLALRNIK